MAARIALLLAALLLCGGQVPYVQKNFYWIPRCIGCDPFVGTYASFPAGGWMFVSDQSNPPTPAGIILQMPIVFPPDFPRQVYFTRTIAVAASTHPSGLLNQFTCWIDPGGQAWFSGAPHGAEAGSDFTHDISLFTYDFFSASMKEDQNIAIPILLNRDAGDLLVCELASSQSHDYISVQFFYLAKNPIPGTP